MISNSRMQHQGYSHHHMCIGYNNQEIQNVHRTLVFSKNQSSLKVNIFKEKYLMSIVNFKQNWLLTSTLCKAEEIIFQLKNKRYITDIFNPVKNNAYISTHVRCHNIAQIRNNVCVFSPGIHDNHKYYIIKHFDDIYFQWV